MSYSLKCCKLLTGQPGLMAKKAMIEREEKRKRVVAKYAVERTALKEAFKKATDLATAPVCV
jgi:hypothetical protein